MIVARPVPNQPGQSIYYVYRSDDGLIRLPESGADLAPTWEQAVESAPLSVLSPAESEGTEPRFRRRVYRLLTYSAPTGMTEDGLLFLVGKHGSRISREAFFDATRGEVPAPETGLMIYEGYEPLWKPTAILAIGLVPITLLWVGAAGNADGMPARWRAIYRKADPKERAERTETR